MDSCPAIPTTDDLGSARMPVRAADLFNPPGLTNFLGTVQVERDITAISSMHFPPLWGNHHATGQLFLDDHYVQGYGNTLFMTWYPDRVEREIDLGDLRLRSTTYLGVGTASVFVRLQVSTTGRARTVKMRFRSNPSIHHEVLALRDPQPPIDLDTTTEVLADGRLLHRSSSSESCLVESLADDRATVKDNDLCIELHVDPDHPARTTMLLVAGTDEQQTLALHAELASDVEGARRAARDDWNAELAAVVTPGNDRYSGSLPILETDDTALWRLYWTGILGVVMFKRDNPASVVGRAYDTLMPRYWPTITFLWDYSISSTTHALLDPEVMERHLDHWLLSDVHTCMGTSWLTGEGVGLWYSVNDYAMIRLANDYVRWTGNGDWLNTQTMGGTTPLDHVVSYAETWRYFSSPTGLADYGGIGNLLECVSSYVHEVASLNAANAWNLRTAADLLERHGDPEKVPALLEEADTLVERLRDLYVEGEGHFATRNPDGSLTSVRHCYDLLTLMYTIPGEFTEHHQDMVRFFEEELRTDRWMRALSIKDPDATYSVRADHQWNGAYNAWPSELARGLYMINQPGRAGSWLRTMSASTNQGPFGQAHFVETVVDPIRDGARKVPPEQPYINDWACSAGGSWVQVVLEGVFGVRAGHDILTAQPQLDGFDSRSRLIGLRHQGKLYDIDASGAVEQPTAEVAVIEPAA